MARLVSLLLLLGVACRTSVPPPVLPVPADKGAERARWFYQQRAYPFGEIPRDGRRKALEATRPRIAAADVTRSWRPIGPMPVITRWPWKNATGRVKALVISPADPRLILVGSSSGGIWRSTDGGTSFAPVSDDHADLSVGAIAFAPSDPRIVYAASGSDFLGTGVLRSNDSGATWTVVSGPSFAPRGTAIRLIIDPGNPERLWVAQTSQQLAADGLVYSSGLLLSEDGGFSWTTLVPGIITDFAGVPGNPSTFFLGISRHDGGDLAGVYRSTDFGRTWSRVYSGNPPPQSYPTYKIAVSSSGRIYLHASIVEERRLLVSQDGGLTWNPVTVTNLPSFVPMLLQAHPEREGELYIGYPVGDLHKSVDSGASWQNLTRSLDAQGEFDPAHSTAHIDQHALAFLPGQPNVLYLGNDGGVFKSTDSGASFLSLADTLSIVQAYRVDAHPTDGSLLFLGTQDNGLERRNGNGTWIEIITGDYGSVLFDLNEPGRFITNYVRGEMYAFRSNGDRYIAQQATDATFGEKEDQRIGFIAPFEHSRRTNLLYFGTWRLFLSHDFGLTWSAPSGTLDLTKGDRDTLSAIALSETDPGLIYTGSSWGRVMLSRDGGFNWADVTGTLPDRWIRDIVVDEERPNIAWIAFSGYRSDHVFRTEDYGASWRSISAGLPDIPVNALLIDPSDAGILYAGTDIGVFRLTGDRWEYFNAGIPPVVVTSFSLTTSGVIVASTYGRGVYELKPVGPLRRRGAGR